MPPELQSYYSLGRGGDGFMPVEAAAQRQGVEVEELMRLVNQGILSSRYEGSRLVVRPAAVYRL